MDATRRTVGAEPGRSKREVGTPPAFLRAARRRLGLPTSRSTGGVAGARDLRAVLHQDFDDALTQPWTRDGGLAESRVRVHHTVGRPGVDAEGFGAQTAVLVPASIGGWWRDRASADARARAQRPAELRQTRIRKDLTAAPALRRAGLRRGRGRTTRTRGAIVRIPGRYAFKLHSAADSAARSAHAIAHRLSSLVITSLLGSSAVVETIWRRQVQSNCRPISERGHL